MADPVALRERAEALRRLADDVDGIVGPSRARAQESVWQCPHADQVRAALDDQTRGASTAVRRLREHARDLDVQAAQIVAQREAERRAQEQRAQQEQQAQVGQRRREAAAQHPG